MTEPMEPVASPTGAEESAVAVSPVRFGPLEAGAEGQAEPGNLDLLLDVPVQVSVEVGRASLSLERVLALGPGAVVELDKKSEEPVDVRVNGKLVARGEVVVVDDCYGIRITRILDPASRLESLRP